MTTRHLIGILRLDAAGCAAGGLALLAAAGSLAVPVGLGASWSLLLLGAVLLAYALENLLVARRPGRVGLLGLAAVDVSFAAAMLAVAALDPTGARGWVRWAMVGVAVLSLAMAAAKLTGARALAGGGRREMVTA